MTPDNRMKWEEAGEGPAVVLLHAFPLDHAMWRPQLANLGDVCRLIVPDLPGFGGSAGFDGPPALERMADEVAALLDALGLREPVVLGGLSMGGYVALAFARKYPGRLRGLVLADTRAEADTAEGRANRDKLIAFAESHTALDVVDQMMPKLVGSVTLAARPAVVEEIRRIAAAQSPAGVVGALRAMRDRPDSTPVLADVRVPTLVITGTDDKLIPLATAEALAARIPLATLATIADAGHLSNLEAPERFNAALRSFLAALG